MTFLTAMALRRPTVALLAIVIVLASGIVAYRSMQVELFPQIEFPLVTIFASYPSADPGAVVREVTDPIERAISGADGLEIIRSTSSEGNAVIFATYKFGTDMAAAASDVENSVNGLTFPPGVDSPTVGRFNPDDFPVIQFGVVSDRPLAEVQRLTEELVIPEIEGIEGVTGVRLAGGVERNITIAADLDKLSANGVSLYQVSSALRENNVTLPAGLLFDGGQAVIAKTTHSLDSVDELQSLVIAANESGPVRLSDVATVSFGSGRPSSISRINGQPGLSVSITKGPDVNTLDVTTLVNETLETITGIPDDINIIVVSDQGPDIQRQIDNLVREGTFGFLFAVSVVFAFMLTIRPTIVRGLFTTIRPTAVIGLSIPLSVFTGILLMYWQDMSLNFMTLGGLAISVGRVVDDSIVVLKTCTATYRADESAGALHWRPRGGGAGHLRVHYDDRCRLCAAGLHRGAGGLILPPLCTHSNLCAVGLADSGPHRCAGAGALLLRPGDLPEGAGDEGDIPMQETWLQRDVYHHSQVGAWAPRHNPPGRRYPDLWEPWPAHDHSGEPFRQRRRPVPAN